MKWSNRFINRSKLFLIIILSSIIACSFAGCSEKKEDTSAVVKEKNTDKLKVLVIGVDGMEPSLLDKYIQRGLLPNFKRIIDRGQERVIETEMVLRSPVIWTSMATGVPPEIHGITDFTIDGKPMNSSYRKVPAFWNILDLKGIKAATLGWWATWPAEKDAGIMIGSRVFWQQRPDKVYPPNIIDTDKYAMDRFIDDSEFISRFTDYPYESDYKDKYQKVDQKYIINNLIRQRLIRIYYRDQIYTDIALELLGRERPEVMSIYLQGVDHTSHAFWQYMEPEPYRKAGQIVSEEKIKQMGKIIPRYYRYIDELIGKLLPYCDNDTYIFLLSDHGFEADTQLVKDSPELGLSGNHKTKTVFVLSGPQIAKSKIDSKEYIAQKQVDFMPTLLYMLGVPIAKDISGRPLLEYFTPEFRAEKKIKYVKTYRGVHKQKGKITSKEDNKVLDDLRGLGYIK